MRFMTSDDKIFKSLEDAEKHESNLKKKAQEEKRLAKVRDEERAKIQDKYDELVDLIKGWYKNYPGQILELDHSEYSPWSAAEFLREWFS